AQGCGWHRSLAGRQSESLTALGRGKFEDGTIGCRLLELAGGEPVWPHHDLIAGRQITPLEESRRLKRPGVGPDCVMIEAAQDERPVGEDLVEIMPADRAIGPDHRVVATI